MALIFEPHNGFGSLDFDGEPWPYGYISEDEYGLPSPVFELNVILAQPPEKLAEYVRLFSAAPDLLEALKVMTGIAREEAATLRSSCTVAATGVVDEDALPIIVAMEAEIAKAEAAIAKASLPQTEGE